MGTTSNATSSSFFNGTSSFSADLQNALTREVQIASLPITQLQNDQTTITDQNSEVTALTSKFTALQSAVRSIDSAVSGSSFSTDVSDPNTISATVSDGATEGNYSILVSDAGANSTSLSAATWVDTPGAAQTYQLSVGGKSYDIAPADNSAASVASAINSQEGSNVQATVVNVGSQSSPDYRISLRSATLDGNPVDLSLGGSSLQNQQVAGRPAQYEVNGSGITVSSNTDTVTISPGLSVSFLQSSATPVDVTLTRSSTTLSNALSGFASAYNAAVDEVDSQRGQSGGALQGQGVVLNVANALSQIGSFSDTSNSVNTLASLGLTLGSDGHITYSPITLLGADLTNSGAVNAFLGSAATGGFLQTATNVLTNVLDPTSGDLPSAAAAYKQQITSIGDNITAKQAQVSQLQTQLTSEMAASDALIASMQQQYTFLTGMFQAMQTADLQNARA